MLCVETDVVEMLSVLCVEVDVVEMLSVCRALKQMLLRC